MQVSNIARTSDTLICSFCGEDYHITDPIDKNEKGFWCDHCDGYTFYNEEDERNRKFYLLIETRSDANRFSKRNQVKLNKRISPLRYPGGKSKIADHILQYINPEKTDLLISPYAGGASVELALLEAGIVKKIALNDIDFGVYSLFEIIKTFPDALIQQIKNITPTHEDFFHARQTVKSDYLNCDVFDAAWSLLLVNRLSYSGIYYANPLGGINGSNEQLLSRWNPVDLCRRIQKIHAMADCIIIDNKDAIEFIEEQYWKDNATLFVDPPYYDHGKMLYLHHYDEDDHERLQFLLDSLFKETPCADIILIHDDHPVIEQIYEYPTIHKIKRKFSI